MKNKKWVARDLSLFAAPVTRPFFSLGVCNLLTYSSWQADRSKIPSAWEEASLSDSAVSSAVSLIALPYAIASLRT